MAHKGQTGRRQADDGQMALLNGMNWLSDRRNCVQFRAVKPLCALHASIQSLMRSTFSSTCSASSLRSSTIASAG